MPKRPTAKRLREEERQAIGAIYQQYIDTFQETAEIPRKVFVKSETLYANGPSQNSNKGQLYTPTPLIKCKKDVRHSPKSTPKKPKKKSNLKSLGDELKLLQHERQAKELKLLPKVELPATIITGDDYTASTNLFVSNLSPHVTEDRLIELFGPFGPLASVKIMWPRNECRSGTNCGFVAFMSRIDAERALEGLRSHEEMRINWGKSVKIPPHPVHVPPALCKLYSPPPPSGLPFNAQPSRRAEGRNILADAVIKVTVPFDRSLLMTIHRVVEFVVREGPEFEAMIMNIEAENPDFKFLSSFQSPSHTYYRWKLYSILMGDAKNAWPVKPFRMYKDGSIWVPPVVPNYTEGMPKELIKTIELNDVKLSQAQADRFIHLVKHLTISANSVAEVMVFCMNHCSAVNDIIEILADSFANLSTNPVKKIARLYLLSDIFHNCKAKSIKIGYFSEASPEALLEIFKQLHYTYKELKYPQDKNCFKMKILTVLRAWVYHNYYNVKFITKLENLFLCGNETGEDDDNSLNDEPLDGANLLKRSLQTATTDCLIVKEKHEQFVDMFTPCTNQKF